MAYDDRDDEELKPPPPAGIPGWMATFADMVTLLLCFFVLLLTQAEIDAKKFKVVAGSIRMAFGVQKDIKMEDPPRGTSLVARDFAACEQDPISQALSREVFNTPTRDLEKVENDEAEQLEIKENLKKAQEMFRDEILDGRAEVTTDGVNVVIRIHEHASFPSGSAALQKKFVPTLMKIARMVRDSKGEVIFAGHTDNIPISNDQYRSNWDLSSARASTLADAILKIGKTIPPERITARGHADSRPLVSNTTSENRARNRRV
jgi:chemotaxis protein MotB